MLISLASSLRQHLLTPMRLVGLFAAEIDSMRCVRRDMRWSRFQARIAWAVGQLIRPLCEYYFARAYAGSAWRFATTHDEPRKWS